MTCKYNGYKVISFVSLTNKSNNKKVFELFLFVIITLKNLAKGIFLISDFVRLCFELAGVHFFLARGLIQMIQSNMYVLYFSITDIFGEFI